MPFITTRTGFFVTHCVVHLVFYVVPETLFNLLFRWPICLLEWMIGEKEMTLAPKKERCILTVRNHHNRTVYDAFGLQSCTYYDGPMYCSHIHTILGALRPNPTVNYRRETVKAEDGNPLCIDYLSPDPSKFNNNNNNGGKIRGMILILPGLTSSSHASYIQHMSLLLCREGYHVAVLNARGVGDTPLEKPQIFSAVYTDDLRHVLRSVLNPSQLQQRLGASTQTPNSSNSSNNILIAIGFSLGGVVLCHYLGEQGRRGGVSHVEAAIAVSAPLDLNAADAAMEYSPYRRTLFKGLMQYTKRHKSVLEKLSGVDTSRVFKGPDAIINKMRSVTDFDREITAPHFGFRSAEEYYNAANCFISLRKTPVPTLCITARNDPICGVPAHPRRWEQLSNINANVTYVELPTGGHLGFLGNPIEELLMKANAGEELILKSLDHFCKERNKLTE